MSTAQHKTNKRPEPWLDYDLADREGEEWRDVTDYEGVYKVSNHGRIKSLSRVNNIGKRVSARIKKGAKSGGNDGMSACLSQDGINERRSIMILVSNAFLPVCPVGMERFHANKNPFDNRVSNIKFGTHSESTKLNHDLGLADATSVGARAINRAQKREDEKSILTNGVLTERVCSKCFKQKPVSEFYTRKSARGLVLSGWCKGCHKVFGAANYQARKEVPRG